MPLKHTKCDPFAKTSLMLEVHKAGFRREGHLIMVSNRRCDLSLLTNLNIDLICGLFLSFKKTSLIMSKSLSSYGGDLMN